MGSSTVELSSRPFPGGTVATLTLSSRLGALGPLFWQDMRGMLTELSARPPRVLIVRGVDAFSVGLDVQASLEMIVPALGKPAAFTEVVAEMQAVVEGVAALPFPVIAAVHGWCIGAGLELAAACDLRLCSQDARFSLPEVKLGITADLGGLQRLPRLIGQGRTAHLALTGDPLDADTAERWGLVSEVLPDPPALFRRTEELAAQLAALPPHALEGTKRVLQAGLPHGEGLQAALKWNAEHLTPATLQAAARTGTSSGKTET